MSGILGIVNLDGSPVDPALLARLTGSMAFRGPDGTSTWVDGPVGLGHTLFRTLPDGRQGQEPATIDGRSWVTSNARLDGTRALRAALEARGERGLDTATDAQLILHAYRVWGDDCVLHLVGDFVFAIWDADRRRLFAARDHLGIRPLFYAIGKGCVVLANSLQTVRAHPDIPDALDEVGVSEILLFGSCQDASATAFAAAKRLQAAHTLVVVDGVVRQQRYWQVTEPAEIRYRRPGEYLDHFKELLHVAVEDRLPPGRFSILMSGGLDSTTLAAAVVDALREHGRPASDVQAHTSVIDLVVPDEERPLAAAAAGALGIPLQFFVSDGYRPFDQWTDPTLCSCEPVANPFAAARAAFFRQAAASGRVALYGTGGDEAISELIDYHFHALWKRRRFGQLAREMAAYVRYSGRLPPIGLRTAIRRWTGRSGPYVQAPTPAFPDWVNPSLRQRCNLDDRWRRHFEDKPKKSDFLRPRASLTLTSLNWPGSMEGGDAGATLVPLEFRHPMADRRLLEYLMAIPAVPWCVDKKLLRLAMKGRLPEPVRVRPKTPFGNHPLAEMLRRPETAWIDELPVAPALDAYVVPGGMPRLTGRFASDIVGPFGSDTVWTRVSPTYFNVWLQQQALTRSQGALAHV